MRSYCGSFWPGSPGATILYGSVSEPPDPAWRSRPIESISPLESGLPSPLPPQPEVESSACGRPRSCCISWPTEVSGRFTSTWETGLLSVLSHNAPSGAGEQPGFAGQPDQPWALPWFLWTPIVAPLKVSATAGLLLASHMPICPETQP